MVDIPTTQIKDLPHLAAITATMHMPMQENDGPAGRGTIAEFVAGIQPMLKPTEHIEIAMSDMATAITVGAAKGGWIAPYDFTLTEVFIGLVGAQSTVGVVTVNALKNGATIFTTKPSIDANEWHSLTGTAAVLGTTAISKGDRVVPGIDAAGTGAKGLVFIMVGRRA